MDALVTVVVPTYRRVHRVVRLLHALADQQLPEGPFDIIVVDDHSDDTTLGELRRVAATSAVPVTVLTTAVNGGPGPARNLGWRSTASRYLAFIDDDCVPTPGWLAAGVAALAADADVGIVQGRTTVPADYVPGVLPRWHHAQVIHTPTPFFEACNLFYRRSALEAAGGFDESMARFGEDSSAAHAAIARGWRTSFAPGATVEHDLEPRGVLWHARVGLQHRTVVALARQYPSYRRTALWRPWAVRYEDLAWVAALFGAVIATAPRHRIGLVAALPWLAIRRPGFRQRQRLQILAEHALVDGARVTGCLIGSVEQRILVI